MLRNSCFGLALTVMALQAQTMSFFRQFTTPGIGGATAVAADASGIYVFGSRRTPQGGQASAGVRKYDSRGNELWTREFSLLPPEGQLVRAAADATGVYVVGFTYRSGEYAGFLRKYSAGGDELWIRPLEFYSPGLAVDGTGVYVAGTDYPRKSSYLRKYNPDGAELWTSRFGEELDDQSSAAVDATGFYVLTRTKGEWMKTSGKPGTLRKWDLRGNELWTLPVDLGSLAAADPSGFYFAGYDGISLVLRKYDAGGNELWGRRFPSSGYSARAVADATGIYVVGTTLAALPGQCRSGSGGDAFVRKYDPDGAEIWTRQFGTSQAAEAHGVALDSNGVYVVGGVSPDAFRDDWELAPREILETLEPGSAFLAKFEKSSAVVTNSAPRIFPDCVVNAASYLGGGVAPGEIVTIFGSAMGPSELVERSVTEDRLATSLADTRILFNGVPAPLVYVSDKQSSAIVPYAVAAGPRWTFR